MTQVAIASFLQAGSIANITNDIIGTGAGFERFCTQGVTDIANASRPIRQSERDAAPR